MLDAREPMPAREPRNYTSHATHLLTRESCGHREAFVEKEPFGWVRACTRARARGWLHLPHTAGKPQRYVCGDVCAAHHPWHRGAA